MPCTRRALAPFVLLVGTVSVRGETCLEPGNDNYYPLYGGRVSGSCVRRPTFVCMDPEAANYGGPTAMSKCRPRAFIGGACGVRLARRDLPRSLRSLSHARMSLPEDSAKGASMAACPRIKRVPSDEQLRRLRNGRGIGKRRRGARPRCDDSPSHRARSVGAAPPPAAAHGNAPTLPPPRLSQARRTTQCSRRGRASTSFTRATIPPLTITSLPLRPSRRTSTRSSAPASSRLPCPPPPSAQACASTVAATTRRPRTTIRGCARAPAPSTPIASYPASSPAYPCLPRPPPLAPCATPFAVPPPSPPCLALLPP